MNKWVLFTLIVVFTSATNAREPQRVNDWTLSSPFAYGFSKGATLGLYDAKKPLHVVVDIPSVAEMPFGLVGYVELHNRFSTGLGIFFGALMSLFILISLTYGTYAKIRSNR